MSRTPPPPPPPPPPVPWKTSTPPPVPEPPVVASVGPTGAFLVELLVYNGTPFNDHWAYWVRSHIHPDIGVEIHANGDVRTGFEFEIKREHDFRETSRYPTARIPLQWVDAKYFNEKAVLNTGRVDGDKDIPVCDFEASVHKISVPVKSLVSVTSTAKPGKAIKQRDCQTWIVESANQLVEDSILNQEVAVYLCAIEQ